MIVSMKLRKLVRVSWQSWIGLIVLVLAACTPNLASPATTLHAPGVDSTALPPVPTLVPSDVAAGGLLYQQHCASCHGANLVGQPNWKQPLADGKYPAPPHDDSGHTWHHNDTVLIGITLNGGDGTGNMSHGNMPAFKDKLTEIQVRQILSFLKSRWGTQQREYQWARTVVNN